MNRIPGLSPFVWLSLLLATVGCQSPIRQSPTLAGRSEPAVFRRAEHTPSIPVSSAHGPSARVPSALGQPTTGIQQVGYLATADKSCGCTPCNAGACEPDRPHGYMIPCRPPWNRFGSDPQEFICDGGDHYLDAHLRRGDKIVGLDPEDTVVHYTTETGDIEFAASNRVCVYAPRFGSVRRVTGALAGGRAITLNQVDRPQGPVSYDHDLPGLVIADTTELGHADVARRADAMRDRNRGVPVEGVLQPELAGDVLAALAGIVAWNLNEIQEEQKVLLEEHALAAVAWTLDEAVEVAVEDLKPPTLTRDQNVAGVTIYEFPSAGRLRICKLADRDHAQPGEVVHFSIQVVNVGDRPVNHVTITDNLTTRLEYVKDSQTCSAGAEFEAMENSSQSLQLIWRLTDELKVGETATMRFRCRVR